jgi:hypothetical protein
MGSKTPSTSTVVNQTQVDPTTTAWKNAIFGEAGNLYNQGAPQYYPGETVTPYSDQTWQGLDMLQNQAQQGVQGLPQAYDTTQRLMSGNIAGMDTANLASSGGFTNPYGTQIAQTSAAPTTAGVQQLQSFADAQNPYLDQLYQQGANKIRDTMNAQFAGAGRTGPNAAYAQGMGDSLGGLYSQIYAPAYEAAQDRALTASGQLAGIQQADRTAATQGLTTAAGLTAQDYDRQLQGAQLAGSLNGQANQSALQASALLPDLYNLGKQPGTDMIGVGGAYEALQQQYNQEDQDRYNYAQNEPWNFLAQYGNLVNGLPVQGTNTTTTTGAPTNRAMSAIGGAAAGASTGSRFGPYGGAIGGILGGLYGAYG